jgi:hypothetical protein
LGYGGVVKTVLDNAVDNRYRESDEGGCEKQDYDISIFL